MSRPESSPGSPSPVEVVTKKTGGKERFATVQTLIPGVSLRTEPGAEVDILKLQKTIEELASLAKGYAERKFQIDKLTSQQKGPDEEIKTLAETHEGLRGVQSEEDNFVLSIFPSDSVTYNEALLEKSMGIAYSSVVHKDLVVSISVPLGFQTEKGPIEDKLLRQVLTQALIDLGLKESDLSKIMTVDVDQRVDKQTLEKMIKEGKVKLRKGTKQIDRTWAIKVVPLRKPPES